MSRHGRCRSTRSKVQTLKYRIIAPSDPAGRWTRGEVGESVPSDFEKYDLLLDLGVVKANLFGRSLDARRRFYFMKDEVELVEEEHGT
jgi:hypothetical protein